MTPNWTIERLYVKPTDGELQNVVITADWRCNGNQDQYYGTCYGQTSFTAPDSQSFVAFDDLTLEQVLDWVWASGIDKAGVEASVAQQIEQQINPPIVSPPLPWLQNSPAQ